MKVVTVYNHYKTRKKICSNIYTLPTTIGVVYLQLVLVINCMEKRPCFNETSQFERQTSEGGEGVLSSTFDEIARYKRGVIFFVVVCIVFFNFILMLVKNIYVSNVHFLQFYFISLLYTRNIIINTSTDLHTTSPNTYLDTPLIRHFENF